MSENLREQAEKLAMRSYFIKVMLDKTTEERPIYLAKAIELEGCFGQGETVEQAVADLKLALVDYIQSLLEDGLPVPTPAELVKTTSSTISKTFVVSNENLEKAERIPNPHIDVMVPSR